MLSRVQGAIHGMRGKLRGVSHRRTPFRSADEGTRLSWASRIESYVDVPRWADAFFKPTRSEGCDLPYAVITPTYEGFLYAETERVVCLADGVLYILTRRGNSCAETALPAQEILRLEVRDVLLDAGIRFVGRDLHGQPVDTAIRFNAVTDHLFAPILEEIRLAGAARGSADKAAQTAVFDAWAQSGFKFMNYARRSLLDGDSAAAAVFQPEIRSPLWRLFGLAWMRTVSPAHACILTDRELILIRDETRQLGDERYGGVWDFIPRRKISALTVTTNHAGLCALSIQLAPGGALERLFQPAAEPELVKLVNQFHRSSAPGIG